MGVHDYVDFVQRNGQDLHSLKLLEPGEEADECSDEDGSSWGESGACEAVIVRVPGEYTVRDILSWKLEEFSRFPVFKAAYSWDRWSFKEVEGYSDVLSGTKPWWEYTVWKSDTFPGDHLVNFNPDSYEAFVLGRAEPEQVPWLYYRTVFENRDSSMPRTKRAAFERIRDCGAQNLWEYDGRELEPLAVPARYRELRAEILSLPLFAKAHTYSLSPLPGALSKARLAVLVGDHACPPADARGFYRARLVAGSPPKLSGEVALFEFAFEPRQRIDIEGWLLNECLICGRERDIGSYVCAEHANAVGAREKAELLIKKDAEKLCRVLEGLRATALGGAPPRLEASFVEKTVTYNLELHLGSRGPPPKPEGPPPNPGGSTLSDKDFFEVLANAGWY